MRTFSSKLSKILYIQYTNPAEYPSLEHSSRLLISYRWKALFLGTDSLLGNVIRFLPGKGIRVKQMCFCPAGWKQKIHYLKFCIWVLFCAVLWRPKWIYASDPFSCPGAFVLSFFPGIKIIYHEHDSPSEINKENSKFLRFILFMRRCLVQRSYFCILPGLERSKRFVEKTGRGKKVFTVLNCPSLEEVHSISTIDKKHDGLKVFYHGSIVPARLPVTLIYALAKLPKNVKFGIVGFETVGHKGYLRELQQIAYDLGIANRLECLGTLPTRKDLLEKCSQFDIGISLMPQKTCDINEQSMAGPSNKPFDYLACGLALLVSDLPEWKEMYVNPGYGLACNPENPEDIVTALSWFLDHPEQTQKMGEQGRQRILEEWNYENQFKKVYQCLNSV